MSDSDYGLPFAAGTEVTLGQLGLHADNMESVEGDGGKVVAFTGQTDVDASVDLWVPAGTRVHPVAAGTVVSAFTRCDVVVVAHEGGEWSEYLHVAVDPALAPGDEVTRETVLGTVLAAPATACGQHGDAVDHLHFAFARADDTAGTAATWVAMAGHAFCGRVVDAAGIGDAAWGEAMTVPAGCGVDATTAVPPTSTPTPTPSPTPAPAVTAAWVAPKDGAKLTKPTVTLSATAAVTPATLSVAKVVFRVAWGSTTKKACTATKVDATGAWSCRADLWRLDAPLGKLKLSFDVTDSAGAVTKAPAGTRTVRYAALPGAASSLRLSGCIPWACEEGRVTVAWKASAGPLKGYKLYWSDAVYTGDPCSPTKFSSKLRLLATLSADARSWSGAPRPATTGRFVLVPYNALGTGKSATSDFVLFGVCEPG